MSKGLSIFKRHPFAVDAFFETSLVLTFAYPKERLTKLIPPCLSLDTFQDRWAFVAVALVKTKSLRPAGFPKFLGNDFFLAGYRIFVRYKNNEGRNLRGLYILKSETDQKRMEWGGNFFTHYKYSTVDIQSHWNENRFRVNSRESGLQIEVEARSPDAPLPPQSPFQDWSEARRYAGPLPFTFTFNPESSEVLIVEGLREAWTPKAVNVLRYEVPFLKTLDCGNEILANAFLVENIPYRWKRGVIEKWKS